ncbi:uncharacterized protein LOC124159684 [Ischnura elegans]|uniref:uncharacterized protein LOC124159684 n=1 Tax=Ischnura elegans TaxID=197161 RepID=UPI001ED8A7C3|nr:uncharacterized protein LOC124159684 [Ischnura elegans]
MGSFSRWPEVYPLQDITAESTARAFVDGWVSRFGTPLRLTTDQGRQFESHLFKELTKLLGIRHLRTAGYNPAANGLVERFHRQLKASIMCHATEWWTDCLPVVLLGIRSAWKDDLSATPAELLYGQPLRLPGDFLSHTPPEATVDPASFAMQLRRHFGKLCPKSGSRHGEHSVYIFSDLDTASHVFVRNDALRRPLQPPYDGPFPVVSRHPKDYVVHIHGRDVMVSLNRLKPAFMTSNGVPQSTPLLPSAVDNPEPRQPEPQSRDYTTRAGRRIHFPPHLKDFTP